MIYTEKQQELLKIFKSGNLKRINILTGSVRSGKTWISLVLWAFWVLSMPESGNYLMCAKTLTSLKRNCLDLLETLIGTRYFNYSLPKKEANLFGRRIYLEGANDARSESKIRGMTLYGAYCDELTQLQEDFFSMLLSRISVPGAKLFGTTNPDSRRHWLKEKYIDNDKIDDKLVMDFLIDDNTTLDPAYVENLKKEYTGVFYDRFILGKWVNAEGLIYQIIADNPKRFVIQKSELPQLHDLCIGIDFGGNKSGHALVLSAIGEDSKLYFLHADFKKAKGTTSENVVDWCVSLIEKYSAEYNYYLYIYPDCAEQTLKNSIDARIEFPVYDSIKNPIIDRIRIINSLLSSDRVRFVEGQCDELINAFSEAVWDDKSLVDKRLDNGTYNNDIIDAAEYSFESNIDFFERRYRE